MAISNSKRRRDGQSFRASKKAKLRSNQASAENRGRIANVDKLPWREVAAPERLEDAQGFFGLEEVDDIDVRFGKSNGAVEFWNPKDGEVELGVNSSCTELQDAVTDDERKGSEWSGVADELVAAASPNSHVSALTSDQDQQPKQQRTAQKTRSEGEGEAHDKTLKPVIKHGTAINSDTWNEYNDNSDPAEETKSSWGTLGLSEATLMCLKSLKFFSPTQIQAAAIPEILNGRDVIGKAPTGSGKTLAYGVPVIESWLQTTALQEDSGTSRSPRDRRPISLILSPTRELAHQITKHLLNLVESLQSKRPRVATLTGGLSLHKQQRLLEDANIVIGTPGRLWDVISSTPGLQDWICKTQMLILDEADRLLSEGHFEEVNKIIETLNNQDEESTQEPRKNGLAKPKRQTLVFSATFQKDLHKKLASKGKFLNDNVLDQTQSLAYLLQKLNFRDAAPKSIDVNPVSQMAVNLKEGIVECGALERDLFLYALLLYHLKARILVFTNSIASARRVTALFQNLALDAHALHSDMIQKARLRAIERFSTPTPGQGSILVATDVAARGLDIPPVDLVVHYHVPRAADLYIHRSGRTARAARAGASILLCAPNEVVPVRRLTAQVHAKANRRTAPLQILNMDRGVVRRLKPRVDAAKRLADAETAKARKSHEQHWVKAAAEELGVDYDSDEFAKGVAGKKGRGSGRRKRNEESAGLGKEEMAALRAQLKELLARRVNVGVSEKYLSAGSVDIDGLINGDSNIFLGEVDSLDFT